MWVFDSTPLIYLAKVERLGVLRHLGGDRLVPELVFEEVVERGLERDYPDARRVQRYVDDGLFGVRSAQSADLFAGLRRVESLSPADAAVIALADAVGGTAVMDEMAGRNVAAVENVETKGTAYVVLSLVKRDCLAAEEAMRTIDGMLDAGWYCSPDLYAKIRRKLDSLA